MAKATEKKDEPTKFQQFVQKQKDNLKFKQWEKAHGNAMARQGVAELRAAFYPESNIAQPTDYGMWGKSTPGETADQRSTELVQRDGNEERVVDVQPSNNDQGLSAENSHDPAKDSGEEKVTSWGKFKERIQKMFNRNAVEQERNEPELDR